jgi:siroheme synthase
MSQNNKKIYLIGVDDKDFFNLTIRALNIIKESDALIISKDFDDNCIKFLKQNNQIIYYEEELSKSIGNSLWESLIKLLDSNKRIAHLSVGDPLIEKIRLNEFKYFKEKKISCEIIPGVIGFVNCLNNTSNFLTDREKNSSITLLEKFNKKTLSNLFQNSYFEKLIVYLKSEKEYKQFKLLMKKYSFKINIIKNYKSKSTKELESSGQFYQGSYIIIERNE